MEKTENYGTVTRKYEAEGNLAVLYVIDEWLFFYRIEKDPHYTKNQKVSQSAVETDGHYKYLLYFEDTVPPDCYETFGF